MSASSDQQLIEKSISLLSSLPGFQDGSSICVTKLQGGCSNQLYTCTSTAGNKVVIRFYGSDLTGEGNSHKAMSEEVEAAVMRKLADHCLYPGILKVFPGGRIEEFVAGRPPTITEINSLPVNLILMRKLAAIHSMKDMPTTDSCTPLRPMFTFDTFSKYLTALDDAVVDACNVDEGDREAAAFIHSFDFRKESHWLQQVFADVQSRVVFCHNDLHKNNIMLDSDSDNNNNISQNDMLIMDYEYAGANYRWADLAIHLTEMSFQSYDAVANELAVPHPDPVFVQTILQCYLDEWKLLNPGTRDEGMDSLSHLLYESEFGEMIIHYARVLFFCAYVRRNYGTMQSWKYTSIRLKEYFNAKAAFVAKYVTDSD